MFKVRAIGGNVIRNVLSVVIDDGNTLFLFYNSTDGWYWHSANRYELMS